MQALFLGALLAPGALAGGACIAVTPGADGFAPGNFAHPGSATNVPVVATHTWTLPPLSAVISSLSAAAQKTPGAVSSAPAPTGGYLTSSIVPPEGCTSLDGSTTLAAATGGATGTGAAGSAPASSGKGGAASASSGKAVSASASSGKAGSASASSGAVSSAAATSVPIKVASTTAASGHGKGSATSAVSSTLAKSTKAVASTTAASASTSASATHSSAGCTSPTARVEWRNMNPSQQQELVGAIKCLMTTPPRSGLSGVKSRWDDLVAVHQAMAPTIHQVGQFLTWHRQFTWVYEQELRNTCKYTGPLPWWDETKDAGNFQGAPMMTSQLYGSAKDGADACVTNGKFGGVTLDIGPGASDTVHCLARGVNETLSSAVTNSFISTCNSYNDFSSMSNCQFFGVHGYTHDAMGGVMSDITSSPNDPIFFLHHAFIDRNYRNWQLVNPQDRTYAIGGYTTPDCLNGGADCQPTTLNYVLKTMGFYPDITAAQAADTQGGHLCYYYDY